jgi:hypothetical protein
MRLMICAEKTGNPTNLVYKRFFWLADLKRFDFYGNKVILIVNLYSGVRKRSSDVIMGVVSKDHSSATAR